MECLGLARVAGVQARRTKLVETVERAIRMTSVRQEFRRITIKRHHEGVAVRRFDPNRLERVVAHRNAINLDITSTNSCLLFRAGKKAKPPRQPFPRPG
jgi:hypothetical protein